jgi:ketosteroid isomerase-like protein
MAEESTTPDLVELTRRAYELSCDREWDVLMSFYSPDSVFDMSPEGLGIYEGRTALRGLFEDWVNAYEEYDVETEEILDLGNGVVFAVVRQNARPTGSTGYVQLHHAGVFVWVEGVIARTTTYTNIDDGRAAAERLAKERG